MIVFEYEYYLCFNDDWDFYYVYRTTGVSF